LRGDGAVITVDDFTQELNLDVIVKHLSSEDLEALGGSTAEDGFVLGGLDGPGWAVGLVPLVLGVEGSAGTQSATLAVRNIATGRMEGAVRAILVGEGVTGLFLGIVMGALVGAYTWLRTAEPVLAAGVAGGMLVGMTAAALVGTLVPVSFKRLGIDPAIATGPFVTATMDLVGVVLFLGVVTTAEGRL
jgi:magnesium transporter